MTAPVPNPPSMRTPEQDGTGLLLGGARHDPLAESVGFRSMSELMTETQLPNGFDYPREFVRIVELGLVNLEPWHVLLGEELQRRAAGLRERYSRILVPFARRQDNDDVACFDVDNNVIAVVHDFASPGFEQRGTFESLNDWLRQAIEDLIDFG